MADPTDAPVGDGWVLVPREPTEEWVRALYGAYGVEARSVIKTVLAAAPIAGDGGDSKTSTGRTLGTKATGETEGESVA